MIKNREFKFRAWDSIKKQWVFYEDIINNRIPVNSTTKGFKLKSNFILSQSTGLKDENGREIYEGDIVQLRDFRPLLVIYQAPSFVLKTNIKNKSWSEFTIWHKETQIYKVIGNKFENPDLLKLYEK